MKKIMVVFLLITGLSNLTGTTFFGGVNMGNVSPPSDSEIEPEMNMGIILGAEFSMGSLKVGAGYFQGGYNVEQSETLDGFGEVSMSGSVTLNYINTYAVLPLYRQARISMFGGLQGGFSLGGIAEFDMEMLGTTISEEDEMEADEMNFDYGLLFGTDYMISNNMGVRLSYYKGFADIVKDSDSDDSIQNTGIQLALLYNI